MIDETLPFDERIQSAMDYLKTLVARERVGSGTVEHRDPPKKDK